MALVLLAEDDAEQRGLFADVLRMNGLDVVEAGDGVDAVQLAFDHAPDVILLDLILPSMSGLDAAKVLLNDPHTRDIPVIAISGLQTEAVRNATLAVGCKTYLNKPFSPMALVAEVKHWLVHAPVRARNDKRSG